MEGEERNGLVIVSVFIMCTLSLCAADKSRVILRLEYPDYINACFVNVSTGYCLSLRLGLP